jgi:hypothetical protein
LASPIGCVNEPLIESNHRVLSKNNVNTYRAPVLHMVIAPLVWPKQALTLMSIPFKLDFYGVTKCYRNYSTMEEHIFQLSFTKGGATGNF